MVCSFVVASAVSVLISILLRSSLATIVPFEVLFIGIISTIAGDILFGMIQFIPVQNKRTGQVKRWSIGMIFFLSFFITHEQHIHIIKQEHGFTCLHRIDSISKQELS